MIFHLTLFILDKQDGLLITWIINWSIANPLNPNANIFHPYLNTLYFSDTLLPQALIAAPFVKFFGEPLLAYNLNFILGIALTGFAAYLLFNKNILLATLFILNPIYLGYTVHIQILNFWPVIFAIYFLQKQHWKLFTIFFVLSSLTTVLFFYFLLLCSLVLRARLKYLVLAILITIPFLIPYYLVSHQFNYVRPITDAIHNSIAPSDLLGQFFPGISLIFLSVFSLRHSGRVQNLLILISSSVLAFGPALHILKSTIHIGPVPFIPLPYTLFYCLVPGFQGLRTPSRWILLSLLFAFIIISQKVSKKVLLIALILLFLFDLKLPFTYHKVPERLKAPFSSKPVVYFPIYGWWDYPGVLKETERMYQSIGTWRPMFNGYSGFSPKEWEDRVKWLQQNYPNEESKKWIKDNGFVYEQN